MILESTNTILSEFFESKVVCQEEKCISNKNAHDAILIFLNGISVKTRLWFIVSFAGMSHI